MRLLDLTVLLQQVISHTQKHSFVKLQAATVLMQSLELTTLKSVITCFPFRRGSSESSEIHPCGDCCFTPDLLRGLFWGFCCPYPHDAVPSAQCSQPSASGLYIHWLGPCEICRCCWISLCVVNKVRKTSTTQTLHIL